MRLVRIPTNKTKVVHSESKAAFNVVGTELGRKYKIARCPYVVSGDEITDTREKAEALEHAEFISFCFNNSEKIKTLLDSERRNTILEKLSCNKT